MPRAMREHHYREGVKAAIYARVSDQSQAEDDRTSLHEQTSEMESYCQENGLTITARYREVGHGWSKAREEFQRMLTDARAGLFDTIVCWKLDRLSRGMYPAAALMEVVEAYQIEIEAVMDNIDMKTFGLIAAIGKIENDNFRERASMGRRGAAKQGRVPTREVPYGYRVGENGRPEIAEDEAEVVRRIFDLSANKGMGAKRIANQLTAEGIPTRKRGRGWHGATVSRILKNETYRGTWWYGKQRHKLTEDGRRVYDQPRDTWIPVAFPPLVDETTWKRAQDAKALRTNHSTRNTRVLYTLQHLVRCTVCGMLLGARATRRRTVKRAGKVYQYDLNPPDRHYRCYGISAGIRKCREHPFIRADLIEDVVWDEVKRVLQHPEVIRSGIESLGTVDDGQLGKKMGQAERELRDVKGEEHRLVRFLVMGKISETQFDQQQTFITEREKNLRASLDEYRNQMAMATEAWNTGDGVTQWAEAVREALEALSPEERRDVMLLVLDGATIDAEDSICITFSIPIQNLAVNEEALKPFSLL